MAIYTVSQLNEYIKHVLTNDPQLRQVWVRGEISNMNRHSSDKLCEFQDDKPYP